MCGEHEYRIGEFAAMTGMSPSKIRFYEKAGLFPERRHANGYRYFTAGDAFRANAFMVLLVYGFSVEEAVGMLDARQASPAFERSLRDQRDRLARQADRLRYRLRRVDEALDLLNPQAGPGFRVVDKEDVLYVRASDGDDFSVSQRNGREIAAFYELLGVTSCARLIARDQLLSDAPVVSPTYVICMPESEAFHLDGLPDVDRARIHRLPMGKCLRFRRQATRSQSVRRDAYDDMFAWLADHGYRLRADVLLLPGFLNLDGQGSDVETLLAPIA